MDLASPGSDELRFVSQAFSLPDLLGRVARPGHFFIFRRVTSDLIDGISVPVKHRVLSGQGFRTKFMKR
jgi:hypothetical protein